MIEQLLSSIRHFVQLTPEEEALIPSLFVAERLNKHDFFLREGEVCRKVAFIGEGLLRSYRSRDGQEYTYYFGREGQFMCDYESFLPAQPSVTTIQALEDVQLLTISHANLQVLYREVREGEKFGRLVAEMIFTEVLRQLTSLYQDSPQERYEQFLRSYSDLQQRVPQYFIASYVGVKPQSLSRIRRRAAMGK